MSRFADAALPLVLLSLPLFAQDNQFVAPGVTYSRITASEGPYSIDVLSIDLTASPIRFQAYRPDGLVPVSVQARRFRGGEGEAVVAAVNADFFSFQTSWPVGNHVESGEVIHGVSSRRSHVAFDHANRPMIHTFSFDGSAFARGRVVRLHGVNLQGTGKTNALYTHRYGKNVAGNGGGKLVVRPLEGKWSACDTISAVVMAVDTSSEGRAVDSALGILVLDAAETLLGEMARDDTVRFVLCFTGAHRPVAQMLGGAGRILQDGEFSMTANVETEGLNGRFITDRHPRTFLGFNRDTTRLWICTVDGRQPSSSGMSFEEMAVFLRRLGVSEAMNLDGGGSTTMVVNGRVVNSPSDPAGERAVANTLLIVAQNGAIEVRSSKRR